MTTEKKDTTAPLHVHTASTDWISETYDDLGEVAEDAVEDTLRDEGYYAWSDIEHAPDLDDPNSFIIVAHVCGAGTVHEEEWLEAIDPASLDSYQKISLLKDLDDAIKGRLDDEDTEGVQRMVDFIDEHRAHLKDSMSWDRLENTIAQL